MFLIREKFWKILLLLTLLVTVPGFAFGFQNKVTSWKAVSILRDFSGRPNEKVFRVSPPEIRRMDTSGAELIFSVTPKNVRGCTQQFHVSWKFERDVGFVREREAFSVQLFNRPVGDTGVGLKKCYLRAKQLAIDGGLLTLRFLPSSMTHFHQLPAYRQYQEGNAQYLFTKTRDVPGVAPIAPAQFVQSALDGFFVQDSPYRQKPGYIDALYGSLSFEVSKGGVFRYNVTYLYRAGSPADRLGRVWNETESGWRGVWTRRGISNVFDAVWTSSRGRVTAVMTISISGNQVRITRQNNSDNGTCDYVGTIGADGRSVSGTYSCTWQRGPMPWNAAIGG